MSQEERIDRKDDIQRAYMRGQLFGIVLGLLLALVIAGLAHFF
jgi:hypothetical protein